MLYGTTGFLRLDPDDVIIDAKQVQVVEMGRKLAILSMMYDQKA